MSNPLHGWEIVEEARKWLGVPYRFGAETIAGETPYETGWDCSEFVEFVLKQLGYRDVIGENFPDGSWNQFEFCKARATLIGIEKARRTPGALIFLRSGSTHQISHVAFTSGDNTTIEARGVKYGTGEWPWRDADWTDAALIPRVLY